MNKARQTQVMMHEASMRYALIDFEYAGYNPIHCKSSHFLSLSLCLSLSLSLSLFFCFSLFLPLSLQF